MTAVHIILNPNSAGGRGRRIQPRLERELRDAGIEYLLHETRSPGHGRELARMVRESGAERLLIVGGDGTIHEVVNGLLEEGDGPSRHGLPLLALLPMGTGNDFFRMIRSSREVAGVVSLLTSGVPRPFEVGRVRWQNGEGFFVNLIGVGIDVAVLRERSRFAFLPGLLQYLAAFVAALRSYRPVPVRITLEREGGPSIEVGGEALLAAVTVGPSIGGGFMVAPRASPEDGLLDFFLAKRMRVSRIARLLPGILRGIPVKGEEVVQVQVTGVRILACGEDELSFELDGELMPMRTPFLEIRVVPASLQILELPGGAAR